MKAAINIRTQNPILYTTIYKLVETILQLNNVILTL